MREHIINEATKLFIQYGFKAIRMDDIATQLGISKRTIYELFGDKEALIMECVELHYRELEQRKKGMMSKASNIIEEFVFMLQDWEVEIESNHKMMNSLRRFYPNVHHKLLMEHSKDGYEQMLEKLQKGIKEGYLLSNVNYDLAISVFTYSIFGIISNQKGVMPNNVSENEAFKYVVTYFFRGIATEKGRKLIDEYIEKKII